MKNWILTLIENLRVKQKKSLPFILFSSALKYFQGHLMYLYEKTSKVLIKAENISQTYNILNSDLKNLFWSKDIFGILTHYSKPLFSQNTLDKFKRKVFVNKLSLIAFTILESAFFYMISEQLVGSFLDIVEDDKIKQVILIIFSVLFGLISALILEKSIEYYLNYRKANYYYTQDKITTYVFHKYKLKLIFSILLLVLFLLSIVYMNLARNYALDSAEAMAEGEPHNPYISICLIIVSFSIAIYIAFIKIELEDIKPKLLIYNKYLNIRKIMNKINGKISDLQIEYTNDIQRQFLSSAQMNRDLRESLEKEIDDRDEELYHQFKENYVNVNSSSFKKYEHLICVEDDLLRSYFDHDPYLLKSSSRLNTIALEIQKSENEILKSENLIEKI